MRAATDDKKAVRVIARLFYAPGTWNKCYSLQPKPWLHGEFDTVRTTIYAVQARLAERGPKHAESDQPSGRAQGKPRARRPECIGDTRGGAARAPPGRDSRPLHRYS